MSISDVTSSFHHAAADSSVVADRLLAILSYSRVHINAGDNGLSGLISTVPANKGCEELSARHCLDQTHLFALGGVVFGVGLSQVGPVRGGPDASISCPDLCTFGVAVSTTLSTTQNPKLFATSGRQQVSTALRTQPLPSA